MSSRIIAFPASSHDDNYENKGPLLFSQQKESPFNENGTFSPQRADAFNKNQLPWDLSKIVEALLVKLLSEDKTKIGYVKPVTIIVAIVM